MSLRSFFGLNSGKSEKSRDHHSRRSPHRETPHHSTRHHQPRRRGISARREFASGPDFHDSDYDERKDPSPRDKHGHGRRDSRPLYDSEINRERLYGEAKNERDRRERSEGLEDEKDRRDVDRENNNERNGRQSERRTGDEEYRSPSLSRALHRQSEETRHEMRDRLDGHSRGRKKHDSEHEPRRSPSHGQEEESPDQRSMPRRPRFTTRTSYQIPDRYMEDPAPGPLPRSATWPSKDPSQRPKPGGETSQLRHSDSQDPSDHRSHRKRDREPARSTPLAQDDPTITPLHRGHTDSTTSDACKSGLAGEPWSETERSLFPGSRLVRLPPPGPVRIMSQRDWESKYLDQDLARKIAFRDLGVTTESEFLLLFIPGYGAIC
jgi:hypothetical protein